MGLFVGLATQQGCLERLGLSQDVRNIQGARAASTRASYTAKWTAFQHWCVEGSLDPTTCPLPQVFIPSTVKLMLLLFHPVTRVFATDCHSQICSNAS